MLLGSQVAKPPPFNSILINAYIAHKIKVSDNKLEPGMINVAEEFKSA